MVPDIIKPKKKDMLAREKNVPGGTFLLLPVTIIVAGLIVAGSIFFLNRTPNQVVSVSKSPVTKAEVAPPADPRPISSSDHILGNPSAEVFIIEYSDLECEFCKEFHATMQKIMDEFGKTGRVAWVYRQFPIVELHPKAMAEAEAAECAGGFGGNVAFWKYIDRIFEITPSQNGLDPAKLPEVAREISLDADAFSTCLASGQMKSRIEADSADAIASGASGTPFVHIISKNGKKSFTGGQSYLALRIMINQALVE